MMLHLTAEVREIADSIGEISNENEEKLKICIKKTVHVIKTHDLLENSYNGMMFLQYTLVTVMVCTIIVNVPTV